MTVTAVNRRAIRVAAGCSTNRQAAADNVGVGVCAVRVGCAGLSLRRRPGKRHETNQRAAAWPAFAAWTLHGRSAAHTSGRASNAHPAVVALLAGGLHGVAAGGRRTISAVGGIVITAVAVLPIAVIALLNIVGAAADPVLTAVAIAVATDVERTVALAMSVIVVGGAVVALLARVDDTVAAGINHITSERKDGSAVRCIRVPADDEEPPLIYGRRERRGVLRPDRCRYRTATTEAGIERAIPCKRGQPRSRRSGRSQALLFRHRPASRPVGEPRRTCSLLRCIVRPDTSQIR